jgi:hypothetical protein
MTTNITIIANKTTNCNFTATYSATLSQIPNFIAFSNCVIEHITETDLLTPSEKLYYLVNDFYEQSLKYRSNENENDKESLSKVKFSASKIGGLLGFSKSKIFDIQQKLEKLEYLQVNRSTNLFNMNNVNVTSTTLPKNVFSKLMLNTKSRTIANEVRGEELSSDQRRDVISKTKLFIPLNFDLFRLIFFHKKLSCNSKLLYLKLFSIIHRIKKKYNYPIYAGGIETSTLLEDCNISRSTLFRSIKQLQENNLIKCEKIRTESSAISSNRFDKIINYTQMLVPKELEHILLSNAPVSKVSTTAITEELPKSEINNDINEVAFKNKTTVSKKDPACVKIIPSNMIKKNTNIKELDKEKIDKKEISKSISNFNKNLFDLKKEESIQRIAEQKSKNDSSKLNESDKLFEKKSLLDFYPLSFEDCDELQRRSGKKYSLNAMNEILRSLTNKLINPLFYSKKSFIAYMTKIFEFELRKPEKVSNDTYKILINLNEQERKTYEIEKYLCTIENTKQVSPEWHMKKKLACVLKPETAYELLKNYKTLKIHKTKAIIELYKSVELTELERTIILSQIKATHERFEKEETYLPIQELAFIMPGNSRKVQRGENVADISAIPLKTGIWGNIRRAIIKMLGKEGDAIDLYWFSKLDAEINDQAKQIVLKSESEFVKDYIFQNYQKLIQDAATCCGFRFGGIYSQGSPNKMLTVW